MARRIENAYGLTYAEWCAAAGTSKPSIAHYNAWKAGEDPSDHRATRGARNRSSHTATRNHDYVVYRHVRVEGEGLIVHGMGKPALRSAVAMAKTYGPGAGVYSISKGSFVGYITDSGRWRPFTYSGQLSG